MCMEGRIQSCTGLVLNYTFQARSQKLLLEGSFGQNVDLFDKIVDHFTKVWTFFYKIEDILNKIVDLFNKIVDLLFREWLIL